MNKKAKAKKSNAPKRKRTTFRTAATAAADDGQIDPSSVEEFVAQVEKLRTDARELLHRSVFTTMVERSARHDKPMLCYRELPDGSAQVCRLMEDGGYECQNYPYRPIPLPRCG